MPKKFKLAEVAIDQLLFDSVSVSNDQCLSKSVDKLFEQRLIWSIYAEGSFVGTGQKAPSTSKQSYVGCSFCKLLYARSAEIGFEKCPIT